MKSKIVNGKSLSAMTLGTVQLGMNYGIANNLGQPSTEESFSMLDTAFENGVTSIDTARAYGTSEKVLGEYFANRKTSKMPFITTKVDIDTKPDATPEEVEQAMRDSINDSLSRLGVEKVDCLLIHDVVYMTKHGDVVDNVLQKFIDEGLTTIVGVSIYTPEDVEEALKHKLYKAIQVPMSIFDQKLISGGYIEKLEKNGFIIFVRSVFLQGLFFMDPDTMTDPDLIKYAAPYNRKLREFCQKAGMSIAEFAISFIRDVPGITSLVLGSDTSCQVMQNIEYMNAPELSEEMRKEVMEAFKSVDVEGIMTVLRRPKN